jgi:hypothetical protein
VCKRTPLSRVWGAIQIGGKAAWVPILIVSSFGLYYNCANYGIQSQQDRADVKTVAANTGVQFGDPSDPVFPWSHEYINSGKQDATAFKLILGTIGSRTGNTKILDTPYEAAKIEIGVSQHSEFVFHQKDFLGFFVVCFIYDDERGHHSEPTFYALQAPEWRGGVRPVTSAQRQALTSGFSCAKLEK